MNPAARPHFSWICASSLVPSFPSSAWERTSAKLCFASRSGTGRDTEFRGRRSQTEFGTGDRVWEREGPPARQVTSPAPVFSRRTSSALRSWASLVFLNASGVTSSSISGSRADSRSWQRDHEVRFDPFVPDLLAVGSQPFQRGQVHFRAVAQLERLKHRAGAESLLAHELAPACGPARRPSRFPRRWPCPPSISTTSGMSVAIPPGSTGTWLRFRRACPVSMKTLPLLEEFAGDFHRLVLVAAGLAQVEDHPLRRPAAGPPPERPATGSSACSPNDSQSDVGERLARQHVPRHVGTILGRALIVIVIGSVWPSRWMVRVTFLPAGPRIWSTTFCSGSCVMDLSSTLETECRRV